jgi:NAD(P)H-dependent FMN reductase
MEQHDFFLHFLSRYDEAVASALKNYIELCFNSIKFDL